MPGVSRGTRIMVWRPCPVVPGAASPVTPITMKIWQSELIAPLDHHLRPLIT